ncbi:replicative DNA helicase [Halomonas cupida]|uniref:replicative DNA helicase n=1 Tax=Halomonas cupida TaxID=44933 RepID=UPI0039B3910C
MNYSMEAEQSVIGAAMLNSKVVDGLADIVNPGDFYEPAHAAIWGAIIDLACRQSHVADVVTVSEHLGEHGHLDSVGGLAYLAEIAKNTPSTSNAEVYAKIVRDKAQRRRLVSRLTDLTEEATSSREDFSTLIDKAQGQLLSLVGGEQKGAVMINDALKSLLDTVERKHSGEESSMGSSFGLTDLDRMTMGMKAGDMIVVGARPSMGKTAFSLNVLRAVLTHDKRPAMMFSMEMGSEAITTRLLSAASLLPLDKIRNPQTMDDDDWPKMSAGINILRGTRLVIDDRPALTPSQIRGAAKRWKQHLGDMGVVVVDYLGLMKAEGKHGNREQEVAEASRSMKALAKELECPVVVLSQLNRNLESRDLKSRRPRMSDLRESGAIEQDADLILFLYRHEVYDEHDERSRGVGEVIIGKQREGRLGTVYTAARLAMGRFDDLSAEKIRELSQPTPPPVSKGRSAMAEF